MRFAPTAVTIVTILTALTALATLTALTTLTACPAPTPPDAGTDAGADAGDDNDGGLPDCPAGSERNGGFVCIDINECANNPNDPDSVVNGGCDPRRTCVDDIGGFHCGDCAPFLEVDGEFGCADIDECDDRDTNPCPENSECINQEAAPPLCICDAGFRSVLLEEDDTLVEVCEFVIDYAQWPIIDNPPMTVSESGLVVKDENTNLIWARSPSLSRGNNNAGSPNGSGFNQQAAQQFCNNLVLDGFDNWRLPTVIELTSIVDYTQADPTINTDAFPDTLSAAVRASNPCFWASTPVANLRESHTWVVCFDTGIDSPQGNEVLAPVRCVR